MDKQETPDVRLSDWTEDTPLDLLEEGQDEHATDKLRRVSAKAMSALNSTTGGALVKPPKFMGKVKLKRTDWNRFKRPG